MEMKRITAMEENGLYKGYYLSTGIVTRTDHCNVYNLQKDNTSQNLKSMSVV